MKFPILRSLILAGTTFALAGCGGGAGKADQQVAQYVQEAMPHLSGTPDDLKTAEALLASAAGVTDASPSVRINAKVLHGQSELQLAESIMPRIDADSAQINRLAWDVTAMAGQIQAHNQLAAALAMYDPAKVKDAIKSQIVDAVGAEDKPLWIKGDGISLPSLSAVSSSVTALQDQVGKLQDVIKSLGDQRTQTQAQGDQLTQQADLAKGNQAVSLYKQAVEARKGADALSLQIDANNIALTRAQQDLAVAQSQQDVLKQTISSLGNRSDALDADWADLQKQIAAQREQAKDILGDETEPAPDTDSTGGPTIASKANTMAALNQKNRANRADALSLLSSASQSFAEAATAADQLQLDLGQKLGAPGAAQRPDAIAWKGMMSTLSPAHYELLQADVEMHRAALFAGQAADAATLEQLAASLKPIADAAGLTLPPSLQDADNKIAEDLKNGREEADLAYKQADDLLSKIIEAGVVPDETRKAAHIARIFTQYGWYLLADSVGDNQAQAHLQAAEAERDSVTQGGQTLTNLPAELVVAAAPAAGTPAPAGH